MCLDNDIDFILSAGGGSSLDATKAIARGTKLDGNIWDVFEKKVSGFGEHIPFASIITIPATGSESNPGSVVTNTETKEKRGAMIAYPQFSICNPEYTFTLPKWQTGAGASDIVSHIFEQYFSSNGSQVVNEVMFGLIRTVKENVPSLLEDTQNYEKRAEILYAGTLALNGALSNGQGLSFWDVHAIEHPLSGVFNITHGAGLAVLTPNWLEMICEDEKVHPLVLRMGKYVFRVETIEETIIAVREMFNSFGMPSTLSELDITEDKLEFCAQDVIKSRGGKFGLFHEWTEQEVLRLYKKSL